MENKIKVLIVDDDEDTLNYIRIYLDDTYVVKTAISVKDAINSFVEFRPHVVITDLRMPGGDGDELVKKISQEYPEALVVLMSGVGDTKTASNAYKNGVFDYLEKPLSRAKIVDLMESAKELLSMKKAFLTTGVQEITKKKKNFAKDVTYYASLIVQNDLMRIEDECRRLQKTIEQSGVSGSQGVASVRRIKTLVDGVRTKLLDLDYPVEVDLKPYPLHKVLEETLAFVRKDFRKNGVMLRVDAHESDVEIPCHHVQISKVLVEILESALKGAVNSRERWVQLVVDKKDSFIEFSITESRLCLDMLSESTNPRTYGGLGDKKWSSYLRNIVEAHNGYVFLDEESSFVKTILRVPTIDLSGKKEIPEDLYSAESAVNLG